MTIYETPNLTGGIDEAIVDLSQTVPSLIPMLLVFIFFTVLIGGAISQRRRTGSADIPMWAVMACLSTFIMTLILSLKPGIVSGYLLSIVTAITIFAGFWLFFDRSRNEF